MNTSIYRATSPSGKCYIGITTGNVAKRWAAHVASANRDRTVHPLRCAIRRHGGKAFTVETIADGLSIDEARALEIALIDAHETREKGIGYNVSAGGEHDHGAGAAVAWARINATPESRAAYIAKLSAAKANRDWSDYAAMSAAAAAWRAANPDVVLDQACARVAHSRTWRCANPDLATSLSRNALACAQAAITANPELHRKRLSAGIKIAFQRPERRAAHVKAITQVWAVRTAAERAVIGARIGRAIKAHVAGLSSADKQVRLDQLATARSSIDHELRKRRQKEAIAAYWTPERRAEKSVASRIARAKQLGRA